MWLNSTLVFLGDFRVFVQERWETGDIFGVTFFSGFPGIWRVWAKPCTDPSVDKRSRERRQRRCVYSLPNLLPRGSLRTISRKSSPVTDREPRVRSRVNDCPLDRRATARAFLTGKWERP